VKRKKQAKKKKASYPIKEWIKAFIIALFLIFVFKMFIADLYIVKGTSMSETINEGNLLLISKYHYGASFSFFNSWHFRIKGVKPIDKNDIVLVKSPYGSNFIKRCVALPGDTIRISKGRVFINNNLETEWPSMQFNYIVKLNENGIKEDFFNSLNITDGGPLLDKNTYLISLTEAKANQLKEDIHIKSIKKHAPLDDSHDIFPNNEKTLWTLDNFGPLVIPYKGLNLTINDSTMTIYHSLLSAYENTNISKENNTYFLNNDSIATYTINNDYYFLMGDNRHNSVDSRFLGPLPNYLIKGKLIKILFQIK